MTITLRSKFSAPAAVLSTIFQQKVIYRRVVNKPPYNKTRNQTFGEFWKIIRPREEKLGAKRPKKIGFLLFYKGKSPKNMIKNWHIIRPFSVNLENFWKIIKP